MFSEHSISSQGLGSFFRVLQSRSSSHRHRGKYTITRMMLPVLLFFLIVVYRASCHTLSQAFLRYGRDSTDAAGVSRRGSGGFVFALWCSSPLWNQPALLQWLLQLMAGYMFSIIEGKVNIVWKLHFFQDFMDNWYVLKMQFDKFCKHLFYIEMKQCETLLQMKIITDSFLTKHIIQTRYSGHKSLSHKIFKSKICMNRFFELPECIQTIKS